MQSADCQENRVLVLSDAVCVLGSDSAAGTGGGKEPAFQDTRVPATGVPATMAEAPASTCRGFSTGGGMMFAVSII